MLFRRTAIWCTAPRVIRGFFLEIATLRTKSDNTPAAGALSKLAESSGKALHGQGGPSNRLRHRNTNPAPAAVLAPYANLRQISPTRMKRMAPPNPLHPACPPHCPYFRTASNESNCCT
jgi:hypothetical protein